MRLIYSSGCLPAVGWSCGFRRGTRGGQSTIRSTWVLSWLATSQVSCLRRRQIELIDGPSGLPGRRVTPASAVRRGSGLGEGSVSQRLEASAALGLTSTAHLASGEVRRAPPPSERCRRSPVSSAMKHRRRFSAKSAVYHLPFTFTFYSLLPSN